MAWMYAGHCATRCGLKEHASRSSSRFGARVASRARRDGASKRGLTSSQLRDVWWLRRGLNVSSLARRAASDASTRFVAAWRRAASMRDCASAVRAGLAFALAVTSGLCVVHRYAVAATLEKGRWGRAGTSRAAAARRAGSSRPTRGGPRTFLYRRSPCAGGAALRGGSGLRRVALIGGLPGGSQHALGTQRWRKRTTPTPSTRLNRTPTPSTRQPIRHRRDAPRTPAPRGRRTSSCAPCASSSRRAAV